MELQQLIVQDAACCAVSARCRRRFSARHDDFSQCNAGADVLQHTCGVQLHWKNQGMIACRNVMLVKSSLLVR